MSEKISLDSSVINSIYSIRKKRVGIHLALYPVIFFVPVISLRPVIWTVTILSIFLAVWVMSRVTR